MVYIKYKPSPSFSKRVWKYATTFIANIIIRELRRIFPSR